MREGKLNEAPANQDTHIAHYAEETVNFIGANQDRPFFLYLPHTALHVLLHLGAAFKDKSTNGRYGDWVEGANGGGAGQLHGGKGTT